MTANSSSRATRQQASNKRPEFLKADTWSVLFKADPNPRKDLLIIEKWRAGLPSI